MENGSVKAEKKKTVEVPTPKKQKKTQDEPAKKKDIKREIKVNLNIKVSERVDKKVNKIDNIEQSRIINQEGGMKFYISLS